MCCPATTGCRPSGFLTWLASWLTFPVCPLLSVPLAVISAVRAVRSGSGFAMTRSALLSPFVMVTVVVACGAIRDYAKGQAVLHARTACVGPCERRAPEAGWSVDARTRLPIVRRMPMTGAATFLWSVNDRVVRVLSRVLGPQRGAWTGAFPGRDEADRAIAMGRSAGMEDLGACPDLGLMFHMEQIRPSQKAGFATAVTLRNPAGEPLKVGKASGLIVLGTGRDFFVLIDPATNREVARYGDPAR